MISNTVYEFLQHTLPSLHIVVVGDIMLDRYVFGEVSRISPEAPVPINHVKRMESVLGGASNVASNLAHLDTKVTICGRIGRDANGEIVEELLEKAGISTEGLLRSEHYETITKIRILDQRQQMLRLDFEKVVPLQEKEEALLLETLRTLCLKGVDGIVLSDYGKGIFSPSFTQAVIALAKDFGCATVVDPKGSDWSKYHGASYITPNVKELCDFLQKTIENEDASIVEAGREALSLCDMEHLVVTRSAKGISLLDGHGVWHSPAIQQQVFDVSGAGDTVVSMLITGIAAGLTHRMVLALSNVAASIVVSKVGTYPIHRKELISYWENYLEEAKSKLHQKHIAMTREDAISRVQKWKQNGEVVVFTNGCFDILHRGHVSYLKEAAALGDRLVIGLNSDASVSRLKGKQRPINAAEDRKFLLENLYFVDSVIEFTEDTPYELLSLLRPHILVKGGDYKKEEVIGGDLVDQVVILPFCEGYSTTSTIAHIVDCHEEDEA